MACITESSSPFGKFRLHLPEDALSMAQRAQRQKVTGRFPPTYGIHETLCFQEQDESKFNMYNDCGERRADAPKRQNTPVVDPTSGFTSVGADAEDGNYKPIESLVHQDHRPGSAQPYVRPITSRIPDLRTQKAPWETKNKDLGNYLGDVQTSLHHENDVPMLPVNEMIKNKEWRDAIATRAFYTSETQRLYKGVDWSNKLPPALDPPPSTLELRPDMVMFPIKRYNARPELWQQLGSRPHSWDYVQSRDGNYIHGLVNYCSPNRKTGNIPGYTGCTSGQGEKDHPSQNFRGIALVRTHKPRFTDTAKRGNIPGYTGHTMYSSYHSAHSTDPIPKTTTARIHRQLQVPRTLNLSPFRRESHISKVVTLVHPFNPFNKIA